MYVKQASHDFGGGKIITVGQRRR